MDEYYEIFQDESFEEINPAEFALNIRDEFRKNPSLWYEAIIPKTKAKQLIEDTENDYSKIWHVHCLCCWKNIDKSTKQICYASKERTLWLCNLCYNKIFDKQNI